MTRCPNCGKTLSEDEKIIYKCLSCNQKIQLVSEEPVYRTSTSNNLCTFFLCLFSVIFVIALFVFLDSNKEYTIEKGNVAIEKVNKIQSNIWNLNPDVNSSKLDKIVAKRNLCVVGMIVSAIGIAVCGISIYGNKNKPAPRVSYISQKPSATQGNSTAKEKLQELEQLYKEKLITEEEYEVKRKKIIDGL